MVKYIDNIERLGSTKKGIDCHIDTVRDFLLLNDININEYILYLLSDSLNLIGLEYNVHGVELYSIAKGSLNPFMRIIESLKLRTRRISIDEISDKDSIRKLLDKSEYVVVPFDTTILYDMGTRNSEYIYFKHLSLGMLVGYDEEYIYLNDKENGQEFRKALYSSFFNSIRVKTLPYSPDGYIYILEKLNEEERSYISKYLKEEALKAIKKSGENFLQNKVIEIEEIYRSINSFSGEKYNHIELSGILGGSGAYDKMVDFISEYCSSIDEYETRLSKEIYNKLFIYKIYGLGKDFLVSPTFYNQDLQKSLLELNKYLEDKQLKEVCSKLDKLVGSSRKLSRLINNSKFFLDKKKTYLADLIKLTKELKEKHYMIVEKIIKISS